MYVFYPVLRDDLSNANLISSVIICMLHVSVEMAMIFFYTFGFNMHFDVSRKMNIVISLLFIL